MRRSLTQRQRRRSPLGSEPGAERRTAPPGWMSSGAPSDPRGSPGRPARRSGAWPGFRAPGHSAVTAGRPQGVSTFATIAPATFRSRRPTRLAARAPTTVRWLDLIFGRSPQPRGPSGKRWPHGARWLPTGRSRRSRSFGGSAGGMRQVASARRPRRHSGGRCGRRRHTRARSRSVASAASARLREHADDWAHDRGHHGEAGRPRRAVSPPVPRSLPLLGGIRPSGDGQPPCDRPCRNRPSVFWFSRFPMSIRPMHRLVGMPTGATRGPEEGCARGHPRPRDRGADGHRRAGAVIGVVRQRPLRYEVHAAQPGLVVGAGPMGTPRRARSGGPAIFREERVTMPFMISCGLYRNCEPGFFKVGTTCNLEVPGAAHGYLGRRSHRDAQTESFHAPYAVGHHPGRPGETHRVGAIPVDVARGSPVRRVEERREADPAAVRRHPPTGACPPTGHGTRDLHAETGRHEPSLGQRWDEATTVAGGWLILERGHVTPRGLVRADRAGPGFAVARRLSRMGPPTTSERPDRHAPRSPGGVFWSVSEVAA